jgi:hypothetical protein
MCSGLNFDKNRQKNLLQGGQTSEIKNYDGAYQPTLSLVTLGKSRACNVIEYKM